MSEHVIWKFELRPWSVFLDVPQGAQLLRVGAQGNVSYVWALVDPDAPKVSRAIFAHPTGVPMPPGIRDPAYVGSFDIDEGDRPLVFHVFDGGEQ
jgi:hypothetical protein